MTLLRLTHCQLGATQRRSLMGLPGTSGRPSVASGLGSCGGNRSRKGLVLYAGDSDGSGMTADQVQKAMDTQLRQTSLTGRDSEEGNGDAPGDETYEEGREVQKRVAEETGTLDDTQVTQAIQRQVGATHADWSHDEEDEIDEEEGVESDAISRQPTDDGSISFTAEELQAVSYDEIKGST